MVQTLTQFLSNITLIVTEVSTMFTSVMAIFMEPPLSIYVGIGVFAFVVGVVGRYLMGRR